MNSEDRSSGDSGTHSWIDKISRIFQTAPKTRKQHPHRFCSWRVVTTFEPMPPNPIEERLARSRDTGTERREYGALRRNPQTPPAGAPPNVSAQPAGGLADDMDRMLGRRT